MKRLVFALVLLLSAACAMQPLRADPPEEEPAPPPPPAADAASEDPVEVVRGVRILQRSNGLPGVEREGQAEQTVLAQPGALRMDDRDGRASLIVRADLRLLWEIDHEAGEYREHGFEVFERARDEEAARRARTAADVAQISDRAKREALARELGVSPDGRDRVALLRGGERAEIAGRSCERSEVHLNGRLCVALWTAPDLVTAVDPVDFYEAIGILPPAVVEAMREVQGFPLGVEVHLEFSGRRMDLVMGVVEVAPDVPIEGRPFDLPEGLRRIEETAAGDGDDGEVACAQAGCPRMTSTRSRHAIYYRGRWRRFCSSDCLERFRDGPPEDGGR